MKQDLDTVTNMLLNNEYKLHEDEENKVKIKIQNDLDEISSYEDDLEKDYFGKNDYDENILEESKFRKNNYEENNSEKGKFEKSDYENGFGKEENNDFYGNSSRKKRKGKHMKKPENEKNTIRAKARKQKERDNKGITKKQEKNKKKKKTFKQKLKIFFRVIIILVILFVVFLYLFFKTPLFEKYRDLWVETAMSTMRHQYLAKLFLSDDEIQAILDKLKVNNDEDSNSNAITITNKKNDEITVEKITGKNYVGFVMTVPNASKVSLVDGRKSTRGSKLSEIVKEHNAVAGINAGGFADEGGVGSGNVLNNATILNKKLLKGSKSTKYSFIGLSTDKKLVLGNYTYNEALNAGVESAIQFGPFLIVNGKNQITNSSSGGIHPRAAIGQKKDGTFIFVVVDGRQPGYSLGTNLLELQNIFNRYDVYNAANLDGGSSATMYYDGKVVNKTSTPMGERYLPNAFIVNK